MSAAGDDTRRAVLAERIANLIGLPLGNVRSLLPLVAQAQLEKLEKIDDDVDFLKESTRLINEAVQKQSGNSGTQAHDEPSREAAPNPDGDSTPVKKTIRIAPKASPAPSPGETSTVMTVNSKAEKKLVLPKPNAMAGNIAVPDKSGTTGLQVPETVPSADAPDEAESQSASVDPPAKQATVLGVAPEKSSSNRSTMKFDTKQVRSPKVKEEQPLEQEEQADNDENVPEGDETIAINMAFAKAAREKEKAASARPKLDHKSKMMLIGIGAVGLIILTLLGVLAILMVMSRSVMRDTPVRPPVSQVQAGDGGNDSPPDTPVVPVDTPVESPHEWACQLSGTFEQLVSHDTLLPGTTDGFTVEAWISASDIYGVRQFSIANSGSQIQFRLGILLRRGSPVAVFEVPRAVERPVVATVPDGRGWIHLAGVFDPKAEMLRLYVNGRMVNQRPSTRSPRLLAVGYVIKGEVVDDASLTLDQIRFSNGARYTNSFRPKRTFETDEKTVSLLHMERPVDGHIRDAGRKGLKIPVDLTGFVRVDPVDFELAVERSLECPAGLLKDMERRFGKEMAEKFKEDWNNFPDEEKRRLREEYERRSESSAP